MSFYPIPKDKFGTKKIKEKVDPEIKRIKKRDNEKVQMPKATTIKDVREIKKENDYRASVKLKGLVKLIIDNNVDITNQYEVNRLVSLTIHNNIFSNKVESKTFIIAFKELILIDVKRYYA